MSLFQKPQKKVRKARPPKPAPKPKAKAAPVLKRQAEPTEEAEGRIRPGWPGTGFQQHPKRTAAGVTWGPGTVSCLMEAQSGPLVDFATDGYRLRVVFRKDGDLQVIKYALDEGKARKIGQL